MIPVAHLEQIDPSVVAEFHRLPVKSESKGKDKNGHIGEKKENKKQIKHNYLKPLYTFGTEKINKKFTDLQITYRVYRR